VIAALLLLAAAAGERFVELGPTRAQRDSSAPQLEFPFIARADEELTAARVRLAVGQGVAPALEVLVNEERVAIFAEGELQPGAVRELEIKRSLLADRNSLTVRLRDKEGRCVAHPDAWRPLQSVGVTLQASPVPLPDELALLPIPFFDRGYDAEATLAVVLGPAPSAADARLAALVAQWFAIDAPIPLHFEAHAGALPDSRAVVLLSGAADAARLGLAAPDGPSVRMIDHPRFPGSNVKLLVIGGRDREELRSAVESLVARKQKLAGQEVRLPPATPEPPAAPYSAPRWVPSDRAVPFAEYPEGGVLAHEGNSPATLSLRFRVAPDLFLWPSELVALDLSWSEKIPEGSVPPRLDVELNGYYVATLPERGSGTHSIRLRIPREHMRGFNELLVHVHYPDPDPCSAAIARGTPPRVAIEGDSTLPLEGASHFANLPDVSKFAFDGFPFTRVPDLGDTAVVLPARPALAELSMLLSVMAKLAQVTGRVGTRAVFESDVSTASLNGKDLLLIGTSEDNRLAARWSDAWPLRIDGARTLIQRPGAARALVDLLGGLGPLIDERRASGLLSQARDVSAIAAIESPLTAGRSAVWITSTGTLPPFSQFLGYAESRAGGGDLLLVAGAQRSMFRIGSSFGAGQLSAWTRLRWFLANHWIALLPVLLLGALLLANVLRKLLDRKMRARLALAGALLLLSTAVRAEPCGGWPLLQRYAQRFISQDGRVLDRGEHDRTTSEGQAYALFFSLVANDRAQFDKLLEWTTRNLARGSLEENLPAWKWGLRRDGGWGVLDPNSASDADLWIAYDLLEAGRLWKEPRYDRLARGLLSKVASEEIASFANLGPMLLPGARGFLLADGRGVRLNPSYEPPQLLRRFEAAGVPGPWAAVLKSSIRMVRETAPEGAVADWVVYRPRHGFAADTVHGRTGSYDAIRAYLWAGMLPDTALGAALLSQSAALPESIDVLSLHGKGQAPVGFYAALLPLSRARGDKQAERQLEERLKGSEKDGLYGDPPAYYDQNLILFARGFVDGNYRFAEDGALVPAWESRCGR
jgi:endo-1,4-beta-D-glucanase Y